MWETKVLRKEKELKEGSASKENNLRGMEDVRGEKNTEEIEHRREDIINSAAGYSIWIRNSEAGVTKGLESICFKYYKDWRCNQ